MVIIMCYGVFLKGGSIGTTADTTKPLYSFEYKALADNQAKSLNKLLTVGERTYYKIKYYVKPIQQEKA